jgi:hypothetical protein
MNLRIGRVKLTCNEFGEKTNMTCFFPKGYCNPLENKILEPIHAI